ncbi:MAG: transketolase C-terminal domain-containing protein [Candidatus Bathyarchaeia archaeon]
MVSNGVRKELGPPEAILPGVQRGIIKAASRNHKILAVMSDLGHPAVEWFRQNAPNRMIELGIAEANAATTCGGLASEGYIPTWYTLAFCLGRAYNQIRQCICVDRFNVKLFFASAGYFGVGGISHNYVEDIAAMRVLPNMVIVNPADIVEAEKAVEVIMDYFGPVYYRIEASPPPARIFEDGYEFELGKATTVRDGDDATLISTGFMVTRSIQAADLLQKEGIQTRVINMSTIKPIDEDIVVKAVKETGAIVTAENHSIVGGLGEAVATVIAENHWAPLGRVGLDDEFSQSGVITSEGIDQLGVHYRLMPEDIAASVRKIISKKR